jgi:hypothetical protein
MTNLLKQQKEKLDEIRKETFKQGYWKGQEETKQEMIEEIDKFVKDHTCSNIHSSDEGTCVDISFVRFPCYEWASFKSSLEGKGKGK